MIREAPHRDAVRELFREYQAAVNAPVCFASFDAELAARLDTLPSILIATTTIPTPGTLFFELHLTN